MLKFPYPPSLLRFLRTVSTGPAHSMIENIIYVLRAWRAGALEDMEEGVGMYEEYDDSSRSVVVYDEHGNGGDSGVYPGDGYSGVMVMGGH